MIEEGTRFKVSDSEHLAELRLQDLVGRNATVTLVCKNKKNPGVFAVISNGPHKDEEWFIPLASVNTRESNNRQKCEKVMRWLHDKI